MSFSDSASTLHYSEFLLPFRYRNSHFYREASRQSLSVVGCSHQWPTVSAFRTLFAPPGRRVLTMQGTAVFDAGAAFL
jgi:hypothetical protein